jgi:hypothetical protein
MRRTFGAIVICIPLSLAATSAALAANSHRHLSNRHPHQVAQHRAHAPRFASQHSTRRHARSHHPQRIAVESRQAFETLSQQANSGGPAGLVTVATAAGIPITIAGSMAARFQGFIADLVARGYRPRQIHCHANSGHVSRSNHYWGGACDFDQHGWGRTASAMYHVADLAGRWGLRDGCAFRDCGHIDLPAAGQALAAARPRRQARFSSREQRSKQS